MGRPDQAGPEAGRPGAAVTGSVGAPRDGTAVAGAGRSISWDALRRDWGCRTRLGPEAGTGHVIGSKKLAELMQNWQVCFASLLCEF